MKNLCLLSSAPPRALPFNKKTQTKRGNFLTLPLTLSLTAPLSPARSNSLRHTALTLTAPPINTHHNSSSNGLELERTFQYLSETLHIDPHHAVSRNPFLRSLPDPLPSIQASHSLLVSAGLSPAEISRVFSSQPLLLTHPLRPALEFLLSLFPPSLVPLSISRCPRLLLCSVRSQLTPALYFLRAHSIPINPSSSCLLNSDVESTLLPKVHFLCSLPIPLYEVKFILRKFPKLLTFNIDSNLKPKVHFLENNMRLHVRTEIRRFPQYFAFSLEKKIKRRHRMLSENGFRMRLKDMLRPSDEEFERTILNMKLRSVNDSIRRKATM